MADAPLWISFLAPAATLSAACAVAYYAHQQWKLAQDKLRFDLFERRYKVFEATRTFLYNVLEFKGNYEEGAFMDFNRKTADAEFLFGPDVVKYLRELRQNAALSRVNHKLNRPVPTDKGHLESMEEKQETLIQLFVDQTNNLSKVFYPYLGYGNIRS